MSDIHALSGAYAIHAVDELERAQFERHLEGCSECQAEVASFREATALLAGLAALDAAATPPPDLRDLVLADARTVRPLPPRTGVGRRRGDPRRRRWLPAAVAAAVAVVGVGVGVTVWPEADDGGGSSRVLTASDRVLADTAADRVVLELGDARATLVRSREHGRAVLVTEAMPPAPEGKVYELWLQTPDDDMVPAGLMPRRTDQTVLLDGDASDATAVGITVEPEGGSKRPTSDPIALFELG
ncbi:anti-sigma factor [Nocardioides campestrisoli]|uniref:anti-sigma factor n=1 Tax=Nocardioides campestrisoli TaxID=2736757 RepID=UPI00163DDE23|nr:anti-sigma factor [Nocardioides campestrisoli]